MGAAMNAPKCLRCGSYALNLWQDRISTDLCDVCYWRFRAELVDDLKARLRAVRQLCHENPSHEVDAALERATDLRVKNWRQP